MCSCGALSMPGCAQLACGMLPAACTTLHEPCMWKRATRLACRCQPPATLCLPTGRKQLPFSSVWARPCAALCRTLPCTRWSSPSHAWMCRQQGLAAIKSSGCCSCRSRCAAMRAAVAGLGAHSQPAELPSRPCHAIGSSLMLSVHRWRRSLTTLDSVSGCTKHGGVKPFLVSAVQLAATARSLLRRGPRGSLTGRKHPLVPPAVPP